MPLTVLAVMWGAPPALAHTSLVSSTPAPSAVLDSPLEVVTLVFSQPVSEAQARVVVSGRDGEDVADGPAQVLGGRVSQPVGASLTPGGYRLAYRVLAEDGHPITGHMSFRVASDAAGAPAAAAGTDPPPAVGSAPAPAGAARPAGTNVVPAFVAVLIGVAVVLVLGAVRAGRRTGVSR